MSIWNKITEWFKNRSDRNKMISKFNFAAKNAFLSGNAPTMLQASASKGNREYRHNFSALTYTGFRIKALSETPLTKSEVMIIGKIILADTVLVRQFVVLGFDTLEIHDGICGLRWKLIDYAKMGTISIE
jgi:hypothetical protein